VNEQLEADRPILCVAGAPGIGRTSVARVLPGVLAAHSHVARIADPRHPWPELERTVAEQLCLPDLSRASLLAARTLGHRVVLVVDGAERAEPELLERLDSLLGLRGPARERLVQTVVLARASGEASEPRVWPWLRQRRAAVWELERISPEETHRYIRKRLKHAGRAHGSLFSETASRAVHGHSQGVPRQVNQVCDAVLRQGLRRCSRKIDADLVAEALAPTAP
jgi:hypothetical protein